MPEGRRARASWLLAGVLGPLLALGAWALASAPGSSPDDSYHLSSIWCAHGLDEDRCRAVPGQDDARAVPPPASARVSCYAFDATKSAKCQRDVVGLEEPTEVVAAGNWTRAYPPVFYWVHGWLVGDDYGVTLVSIRALNALIVVGLVTALTLLVPRQMRPAAAVPILLCSVPLGMSLFSSTNPSAWGIAGPSVLWLALHATFATVGTRRNLLLALSVLAAVVGAGARADACLFTAMAVGLALILNWRTLRRRPLSAAAGGMCLALAGLFFLGAGQASALSSGLASEQVLGPASKMSATELVVANIGELPTLWTGFLGSGSMGRIGWLDTGFPALVGFSSVATVVAVVVLSWSRPTRGQLVAVGLATLSLFVYPLYILAQTQLTVGQGVQPRYLMPLAIIAVGLVLLIGGPRLSKGQAWTAAGALALAHAVALHVQIRRYVTGLDVSDWNLDPSREWWWDIPIGPTVVWVAGSLAFAAGAAAVLRLCVRETVQPPENSLVE